MYQKIDETQSSFEEIYIAMESHQMKTKKSKESEGGIINNSDSYDINLDEKLIYSGKRTLYKFLPVFGAIFIFLLPSITSVVLSIQYHKQCLYHQQIVPIIQTYGTLSFFLFIFIGIVHAKLYSKSKSVYGILTLVLILCVIVESLFVMALVKLQYNRTLKLARDEERCTYQIMFYLKALVPIFVLQMCYLVLFVIFSIKMCNQQQGVSRPKICDST